MTNETKKGCNGCGRFVWFLYMDGADGTFVCGNCMNKRYPYVTNDPETLYYRAMAARS